MLLGSKFYSRWPIWMSGKNAIIFIEEERLLTTLDEKKVRNC
jgi:hypothetical protein